MIDNNITLGGIAELLRSKKRILIISHSRPDGDTLACAFALKNVLKDLGKEVVCTSSDRVSERLSFLCDGGICLPEEVPADYEPDLVVSVDVASRSMLGDCEKFLNIATTLKIDHHDSDDVFGCDHYYTDNKSASCAEIVFDLIDLLSDEMSLRVCELLYAGISFDTGCFMHSNVTESTFKKAAYLVSRKIDSSDINHRLFGNKTQKEIEALKMAYNSLKFYENGRIAVICITNEMRKEKNLSEDDVSDLANIPIDISGVQIGITLKEKESAKGNFKVSMRSRPGINARSACNRIGGGGHLCAAGGLVVAETEEEAVKKALEAAIPEIK